MKTHRRFPTQPSLLVLEILLLAVTSNACWDTATTSSSSNGYLFFEEGNFAFLAPTASLKGDMDPISITSKANPSLAETNPISPETFAQETGTTLLDWVSLEFDHSSRVQGKDAKPVVIEWTLDSHSLPSFQGVELFYQLEAKDTAQAREIGIHGEGPVQTGWFPFLGPIRAQETKTTGLYQVQIPIWALGQITRFAIGQSQEALQPISFQSASRSALKTTKKKNTSSSVRPPLTLKEVFAAVQNIRTGVDTASLPLSPDSTQGLDLASGDISLTSPWLVTCDSRGLGNSDLCQRDSPSELLTRTAEAAEYASNFLFNVEQSFSDNGWKQLRIKHLSGDQAQQALESSNQTQTSVENSAAPHGFVLIGKNRCGRADAAACYEPLQQIIVLVGSFVANPVAPQGFDLQDIVTHEVFHAVQAAELPDLMKLPISESDWIVEATAAYYQLLSAGVSIYSSKTFGEVRDWNIPLQTIFADSDHVEPYRNHVFFASITEGSRGSLASLLRALENHTLSDIYRAMGMAIQDTQPDRFGPFAYLDDPVRDALAGAFVRATSDAVARREHDCDADLDMLRGVNPDVALDRDITTLPMTSHCRRFITADDEIRAEKACLKIKIPEIPGDLEDRGIFQIQVHGKTFPSPDGEAGVTLVTGPIIDIQLLDLDSKRDRTSGVKRRYEITKAECTPPDPQQDICGAYKVRCTRECRVDEGCDIEKTGCSIAVYSSTSQAFESVLTCMNYSDQTSCGQGRIGEDVEAGMGSCQNVLALLKAEVYAAPHGSVRTWFLPPACDDCVNDTLYSVSWEFTPVDLLPLDRYCGDYYFCDPIVIEGKSRKPPSPKGK